MKHLFYFLVLFFSLSKLQAQNLCKAGSVFFDLNKSELKPAGQFTVDSLVKKMSGSDFILEIYGYADTSNTADYNRKLSQSRIDAVLSYLQSKNIAPKEVRTFNEGEDFNSNDQNKSAAFQRRVDVYLTLMEGNDVTFKSASGVVVKRDLASFGDCGICTLKPRIKYLQTEDEANANGIDLLTDKGERLITYGMALFDIDPCSSVPEEEQKKFKTCMQMPASNWSNDVKLFELIEQPGNDVWRRLPDSIMRDKQENTVQFCSYARKINCDAYDNTLSRLRLRLVLPEESQKGKSLFTYVSPKNSQRLSNDTVNLTDEVVTVISYFSTENDWYFFHETSKQIQRQFLNRDSVSPFFCTIYISDYRKISPKGKVELKVKLKGIEKMGYYNPDFDVFVELKRNGNNTYSGFIYEDGFELCYIKKGRYYLEKNKAKKLKLKAKDGYSKGKIKQVYFLKKNKLSWKRTKTGIL